MFYKIKEDIKNERFVLEILSKNWLAQFFILIPQNAILILSKTTIQGFLFLLQ